MTRRTRSILIGLASMIAALPMANGAEIKPLWQLAPTHRPQTSIGLDLATSALRMRGHITARSEDGRSTVMPQLYSTLTLAPKVQMETRVDFPEWNSAAGGVDEAVEVKLRLRSMVPLIDEIEGRSWRGSDGLIRHAVRVATAEPVASSVAGRPITLGLGATVEQTEPTGSPATVYTGLEANLTGFGRTAAENRVGLQHRVYSNASGRTTSVLLGRSWRTGDWSRIAVNYTLMDATERRDNRIAFSWLYEF
jgi:hypothetical protein